MKRANMLWLFVVLLISIFFQSAQVKAKTIYVDLTLNADSKTYNPETRSSEGGRDTAFNSVQKGLNASAEGDTIVLRSGNYEQIRPNISKIVIKAYQDEVPVISGLSSVALWLEDVSRITIDGVKVEQCLGFGRIYRCDYITIKNCIFNTSTGSGTTSGLKLHQSRYCRIIDSEFSSGGGDMVILQDNSNYNLIERNTFKNAEHSLLSIRCCSYNIVRNNEFYNEKQKAVEIFDCEGVSDAPFRLDDTKHNVIEKNEFTFTRSDTDDHSYNAIQHCAQFTIVRNNLFRNCLGGGLNYQRYSDECLNTYSNRMYNNTFYQNKCYAIIGDNSYVAGDYYDNQGKNNLLYKNENCNGAYGQIRIEDANAVILFNNTEALSSPGFVDENNNDFHLADTSSQIDAGVFVATVISASGTDKSFTVDDASWFHDGFGIPGEAGDLIQLEDQSQKFRIVGIDYETNVVTLDKTVSWVKEQGIHLAYSGSRPDIGAFEYVRKANPSIPTNLKIK